MPNPNRPQYQDTIEETWGQAVADTVVRRYANTADRDADLAGFTPAELAGQVVAIIPGGSGAYLERHDGSTWRDNTTSIQSGSTFVTTDAWGTATITPPIPWRSGDVIVVMSLLLEVTPSGGPANVPAAHIVQPNSNVTFAICMNNPSYPLQVHWSLLPYHY
jgi:hypothetical protein